MAYARQPGGPKIPPNRTTRKTPAATVTSSVPKRVESRLTMSNLPGSSKRKKNFTGFPPKPKWPR